MNNHVAFAIAPISLAASLLIGQPQAAANTVLQGAAQPLGDGEAHTYVVLDDANQPTEVGVLLTEAALSDLPMEHVELNLAMPADLAAAIPFTHVGLNWQPHGHMPEPIYGSPHFDVHFYTISEMARQCITNDSLEHSYTAPAAEHIPAGYVLAPDSAEASQGSHWVNPNAAEFQREPQGFDYTFIYGFHNGQLTFLEPMIGLEFLAQRQSLNEAISLPEAFAQPGPYPTSYSVTYDVDADAYRISLTNFQE